MSPLLRRDSCWSKGEAMENRYGTGGTSAESAMTRVCVDGATRTCIATPNTRPLNAITNDGPDKVSSDRPIPAAPHFRGLRCLSSRPLCRRSIKFRLGPHGGSRKTVIRSELALSHSWIARVVQPSILVQLQGAGGFE